MRLTNLRDSLRRAFRTALQLIAGGGLTALVDEAAGGLNGTPRALVLLGATYVVAWAQNELEDMGAIPAVLKAPASDGADPLPEPQRAPRPLHAERPEP